MQKRKNALTLAAIATLVAITELAGLVDAGGGSRGHDGAEGADVSGEVNLDGGVATGIEDLASNDGLDSAAATTQTESLLAEDGRSRTSSNALVRKHGASRRETGGLHDAKKYQSLWTIQMCMGINNGDKASMIHAGM